MATAAPPQPILQNTPINAVLEKFEAAGRAGLLDLDRFLRQVHAAAELPGSFARQIASNSGEVPPELVSLFVNVSRKLDGDFTRALVGAYLTPMDCEDLRSILSHVARGVRLEARAAVAMNESTAAVLAPLYLAMAGCWDDYAAMISLVGGSSLIATSRDAEARRKSAMDRLRSARMDAGAFGCSPRRLFCLLEGFQRLEAVFAELRDAQRSLLSFSLKYC